jgi:hypothetical protein
MKLPWRCKLSKARNEGSENGAQYAPSASDTYEIAACRFPLLSSSIAGI